MDGPANRPDYYDISESRDIFDLARHIGASACVFNALKYLIRAGHKDSESYLKDLNKAKTSIEREIEYVERDLTENESNTLASEEDYIGISESRILHILGVARRCGEIAREEFNATLEEQQDMFLMGFNHDIGYEFSKIQTEHEKIGGKITDRNGFVFSDSIMRHGAPIADMSKELYILNKADMETSSTGERVTMEERLNDIEARYGEDSIQTHNAYELCNGLRNWLTQRNKSSESVRFYVDGSFNKKTETYGFGGCFEVDGVWHTFSGSGRDPEKAKMRNVSGEIDGAMAAVNEAKKLGLKSIIICYDYEGIEKWATCEWKRNNKFTKAYSEFMMLASTDLEISFEHIKAHSGNIGNERADNLAKSAVGLS